MASTPHSSFRLSRRSNEWLDQQAKDTGRTKTQLVEALIADASTGGVMATGQDAAWLRAEAKERGLSAEAVLADTVRTAKAFPAAYFAHVNAVQSWTAARLVTALFNRMFGEDAREILDACAEGAAEAFGPEPDKPKLSRHATPKSLRRVFTDIPDLP